MLALSTILVYNHPLDMKTPIRSPQDSRSMFAVVIGVCVLFLLAPPPAPADPWRVDDAEGMPDWLSVSGTFRLRYEVLDEQFRASLVEDDQVLVARTLVHGQATSGAWTFGLELEDARQEFADSQTPLNTTVVNTVEILRAYARWRTDSLGASGVSSDLTVGRLTMDAGSRRLVARNRYRNTINAFNGVDWKLDFAGGQHLRAFYTLPVRRLPEAPEDLLDNRSEIDDEDLDVRFWGLYWSAPAALAGDPGEVFVLGLEEDDVEDAGGRGQDLTTAGYRVYRPAAPGALDYEIEGAYQFGRTGAVASVPGRLDHSAWFQHAELGYTFEGPRQPRIAVQLDYASGDRDPTDDRSERFDTLFGARRFDFGPTGVYGPFARSNLVTPGVRIELLPGNRSGAMVAHRAYWLASARDAWTTSGLADPTGGSGRFLGQQIEGRLWYDAVPGSLRVEGGVAHLFLGSFPERAPNGNGNGDPTYVYAQATLSF